MQAKNITPEDFERLEAKLDAVNCKLDGIVAHTRWQAELMDDLNPIAREVMRVGADKLQHLEEAGYIGFGREALRVLQRVADSYTEDDVRLLGDHIVGIMNTVKNVTQPAILAVANEATDVLSHADDVAPMGVMGMVKASQEDDVKKGTAVLFEILRHVGRTVSEVAEKREQVGPAGGTAPAKAKAKVSRAPAPRPKPASQPSNGAAHPAPAPGNGQAGWELCANGHLSNPELWNDQFASAMAASLGFEALSPEQQEVVQFARGEWAETGAAPNIRRLSSGSGVTAKQLYTLFPKAPARTVAKIAGIPKPAGCI